MKALIDTGFLLAVLSANDREHTSCSRILETEREPLLPSAILTELAYMVIRDIGYPAFVRFMHAVFADELTLVFPIGEDLERAIDIMEQYADARIDFVDCVLAAMAERLNISRILTVDQRHFRILRPKHVMAFEILP